MAEGGVAPCRAKVVVPPAMTLGAIRRIDWLCVFGSQSTDCIFFKAGKTDRLED